MGGGPGPGFGRNMEESRDAPPGFGGGPGGPGLGFGRNPEQSRDSDSRDAPPGFGGGPGGPGSGFGRNPEQSRDPESREGNTTPVPDDNDPWSVGGSNSGPGGDRGSPTRS